MGRQSTYGPFRGGADTEDGVGSESGDRVKGVTEPVTGHHLGGHLAYSPGFVGHRLDNCRGGPVVPFVQQSACGPHSRPVPAPATLPAL
jgi:hypothetical protein